MVTIPGLAAARGHKTYKAANNARDNASVNMPCGAIFLRSRMLAAPLWPALALHVELRRRPAGGAGRARTGVDVELRVAAAEQAVTHEHAASRARAERKQQHG
jgi:hypothetical protein